LRAGVDVAGGLSPLELVDAEAGWVLVEVVFPDGGFITVELVDVEADWVWGVVSVLSYWDFTIVELLDVKAGLVSVDVVIADCLLTPLGGGEADLLLLINDPIILNIYN
tara:strand:+ start:150 stop:476 length:327 start_codon:yes stop_codon:yes gene_type:complete